MFKKSLLLSLTSIFPSLALANTKLLFYLILFNLILNYFKLFFRTEKKHVYSRRDPDEECQNLARQLE